MVVKQMYVASIMEIKIFKIISKIFIVIILIQIISNYSISSENNNCFDGIDIPESNKYFVFVYVKFVGCPKCYNSQMAAINILEDAIGKEKLNIIGIANVTRNRELVRLKTRSNWNYNLIKECIFINEMRENIASDFIITDKKVKKIMEFYSENENDIKYCIGRMK